MNRKNTSGSLNRESNRNLGRAGGPSVVSRVGEGRRRTLVLSSTIRSLVTYNLNAGPVSPEHRGKTS